VETPQEQDAGESKREEREREKGRGEEGERERERGKERIYVLYIRALRRCEREKERSKRGGKGAK